VQNGTWDSGTGNLLDIAAAPEQGWNKTEQHGTGLVKAGCLSEPCSVPFRVRAAAAAEKS
jgi:hypothetical protein